MSYHGLAVVTIILYVVVLVLLAGLVFFWFRLRQLARAGITGSGRAGVDADLDHDAFPESLPGGEAYDNAEAGIPGASNAELENEVEQLKGQLAFTEQELEKVYKEYEALYQKTQGKASPGDGE